MMNMSLKLNWDTEELRAVPLGSSKIWTGFAVVRTGNSYTVLSWYSANELTKKTGQEEVAERYYISSKNASAKQFNGYIRSHWGIENKLHWTLDVAFREDQSKKREGESAQNYSLMTKLALNLIKNHHPGEKDKGGTKISARRKRNMAAWDNDYLLEIIRGT